MKFVLHAATIMHTNVATDVHVARACGYDGIELWIPKLARYLDAGFTTDDLREQLGPLRVTMLDTLMPIESADADVRRRLLDDAARMARVAAELGCPALQVVALDGFERSGSEQQRRTVVASLSELADVAGAHGVRLAVEPVVFSPFRSLSQALEAIDAVGADRVGLCLDTWHLWTSGTDWEEVAALDRELIVAVHLGDTAARAEAEWTDADRSALPGEGVLPLRAAVTAILTTGYDGPWAVEMKSERHWEWEPEALARAILERARQLMAECAAR
jgi:sugar phosphate isomerase/epimerase